MKAHLKKSSYAQNKGVRSGASKPQPSVRSDGWMRNDPYFIFKGGYKIAKVIINGVAEYHAFAPRVGDKIQHLGKGSVDECKLMCENYVISKA